MYRPVYNLQISGPWLINTVVRNIEDWSQSNTKQIYRCTCKPGLLKNVLILFLIRATNRQMKGHQNTKLSHWTRLKILEFIVNSRFPKTFINLWPEWIHRFLWCTMIQTDLGSLILIQITPKECTLSASTSCLFSSLIACTTNFLIVVGCVGGYMYFLSIWQVIVWMSNYMYRYPIATVFNWDTNTWDRCDSYFNWVPS